MSVATESACESASYVVTPIECHLEVSYDHWRALSDNVYLCATTTRGAVDELSGDQDRPNTIWVNRVIYGHRPSTYYVRFRGRSRAAYRSCNLVFQLGRDGEDLPLKIEETIEPLEWTTAIKMLTDEELLALVPKVSSDGIIHLKFTANEVVPRYTSFESKSQLAKIKNELRCLLKPTTKDFSALFDGEPFSKTPHTDFSITSGEDEFQCHKLVLCMRIPVFERMINGDGAEATNGSADLSEYGAENAKLLLEVIYGVAKIDEDTKWQHLLDLYKLLHLYGVEPELNFWAQFFALKPIPIDASNVATVANFATVYGLTELKKKCAEALFKMPRSTFRSEEWKQLNGSGSGKTVEIYRELFESMMLQDE